MVSKIGGAVRPFVLIVPFCPALRRKLPVTLPNWRGNAPASANVRAGFAARKNNFSRFLASEEEDRRKPPASTKFQESKTRFESTEAPLQFPLLLRFFVCFQKFCAGF